MALDTWRAQAKRIASRRGHFVSHACECVRECTSSLVHPSVLASLITTSSGMECWPIECTCAAQRTRSYVRGVCRAATRFTRGHPRRAA
eukprot:933305-Pleurochrysis_carterae.AAC.2